jgi:hypothetical protein
MALSGRQQIAFRFQKPLGHKGFVYSTISSRQELRWMKKFVRGISLDFPNISKKLMRALARPAQRV